jgi:type VI secretion system protein ImpM
MTAVFAFGKVPRAGDFVRTRGAGDVGAALEEWVTTGLERAEGRGHFADAFAHGAIHAFVFRTTRAPGLVAGVVRPSRDAVGRRFPFVVAASVEVGGLGSHPHLLPLLLGDFLEGAAELALAAETLGGSADLERAIGAVRPPRFDHADAVFREYDGWLRTTAAATAWGAIYGDTAAWSAAHAIHTIEESVAPIRGHEPSTTTLGLRLPLGGAGSAAVAFWLDLVRAAAHWRATVPSFFWSTEPSRGSLVLQLGETPASTFEQLWLPDPDSDHLCDLTQPRSVDPSRFLGALSPSLGQLVQRGDLPVLHLVDALAR